MPPLEKGGNFSIHIADQILSGLSFSSERRPFMPLHSYLFPVCSRSIPQTRTYQRSVPCCPSHTPLPPLGRTRLRSCTIAPPACTKKSSTADDAGDLCKLLVCKILAAVLISLDYCLITGGLLSCQADEDAEREVLVVVVT